MRTSSDNGKSRHGFVWYFVAAVLFCGCAEGPFWRTGRFSPWVRDKWAAEEQVADTLFERKRQMTEAIAQVHRGPVEKQQAVAEKLADVVHRDPILLLRLQAVQLLGDLSCPAATEALAAASTDPNADVRIAAIRSLERQPPAVAIRQLQEVLGSDTNVDVRLAATKALASFSGGEAIQALSMALTDNDPAVQLRATESLARVTGESLGPDVARWKDYVARFEGSGGPTHTATRERSAEGSGGGSKVKGDPPIYK
jgi:HEAT repeat protein